MEKEYDEKILQFLKEYDELHFCLLIILYYYKSVNKIVDLDQMISKNPTDLLIDLPSGIVKFLKKLEFENKLKLIEEKKLGGLLRQKCDYLEENIKSVFSLWKLLFYQFARLSAIDCELLPEVFLALNMVDIDTLKSLLYVGNNFNESTLSELLFILVQLKNYDEIHIINYDEGNINLKECLEDVRDSLFHVKEDVLEAMMERVIIVEKAQLNFEYLYAYVEQNSKENFIIIIGMERLVEFKGTGQIDVKLAEAGLNLSTSENVNWSLLLDKINRIYQLLEEKGAFLLTVYFIDNLMDDAEQEIGIYYKDSMLFNVLFDRMNPGFYASGQEGRLCRELFDLIFNDNNAYDKILSYEGELSEENFILLKAYFNLFHNDYFHAILELEKLSDDAGSFLKFLLAELYNITEETEKAYGMLKEIYEKDKFFPNIVTSIVYSLRHCDNKDEQLLWIKKGLALNPKDPVMISYLANYYTRTENYLASAEQWKVLYDLTDDPFYGLLHEINLIIYSADKKQMNNISAWTDEMVSVYPQYADEIYSRVGNIIFDKINKESALPYFEKVAGTFDESCCVSAIKKMEIYYRIYSRRIDKEVRQSEVEGFVQKLIDHVLILTYSTQSVYSWSDYIHKLFPYAMWVEISSQLLICRLMKLVKGYLNGEAGETRLIIDENKIDNSDDYFQNYEGAKTPNLEVMNQDEYLLLLLVQGKAKIAEGEIQLANDIAYTFFRLANTCDDCYHKNISMCFGLLIWSGASMAIGAFAESILSFAAAADRLSEIGETAILHEFEFVYDQFLYLYSRSFQMKPDVSALLLFEDYFNKLGYPKVMLYCLEERYKDVIEQESPELRSLMIRVEEANIVLLAKNESLNNIIIYDSLISAYYEIGELEKAKIYLCRLYPTINLTLISHIDIAQHFLKRYSNILMHLKDYDSAIEIFKLSLLFIEKLRGISFSSERAYLGDSVDTIVRRMIYIICEKNNRRREKLESDELLIEIMIHLVPRAIIEERNGNYEIAIDERLLSKEKEYYQLFDLLNNIKDKSMSNLFYKQIADRFLEIKRDLEENHPRFKPLQPYSLIGCNDNNPFVFIGNKLKEGEVFYRNILTEDSLVHILINRSSYKIYSEKICLDQLNELLKCLEEMINENMEDLVKSDFDTYIHLFENLTQMLFQPLIDKIDLFDSLYYMPDHKLLHITPNFIRVNGKWGIECFNRIELVVDYNNIGNSKREPNDFSDRFFISDSKKGMLQELRKTIDQFPSFIKLDQEDDGHIIIKEPVNMLIVAAHGISKEFGESYWGAKRLELSRKRQVDLREFIELRASTIENAIIFACSGGTPTDDKIEWNNGVWDAMLRKRVKYILYCKWDVSTEHANDLLAIILQEMSLNERLLSEALNIAQRKRMHLNPIFWAGLEVWKNYY